MHLITDDKFLTDRCSREHRNHDGYFKDRLSAKEKGKMRVEGKDYAVQDGDVMHFRVAT